MEHVGKVVVRVLAELDPQPAKSRRILFPSGVCRVTSGSVGGGRGRRLSAGVGLAAGEHVAPVAGAGAQAPLVITASMQAPRERSRGLSSITAATI